MPISPPKRVPFTCRLPDVYADHVKRPLEIGPFISGMDAQREIELRDVPAEHLSRISVHQPAAWDVCIVAQRPRALVLRLSGRVPEVPESLDAALFTVLCDIWFRSDEVRHMQLKCVGTVLPEWTVPRVVGIGPLSEDASRQLFSIVHRSADASFGTPRTWCILPKPTSESSSRWGTVSHGKETGA